MRRLSLLLLARVLVACSQPLLRRRARRRSGATTVAAATARRRGARRARRAPTAARTTATSRCRAEKFTESRSSNFEEAQEALLAGYYDGSITEEDLYRAAVAGMLERVDPKMHKWNKLLSPSELAELRSDLQGELVGIGIGVDLDPATGYIDVKRTYPGLARRARGHRAARQDRDRRRQALRGPARCTTPSPTSAARRARP